MKNTVAIVLAAGEGTRFKSDTPKVLHKIMGKTLVGRVLDTVGDAFDKRIVVIGHKADLIKKNLDNKSLIFAIQKKQSGSGDAVKCAEKFLKNFDGAAVVLCGDVPLLKRETVNKLLNLHKTEKAAATVITCEIENPSHYGRILRNCDGTVKSIVEAKDAPDSVKQIKEINSGIYAFSSKELFSALRLVKNDNSKGEYYLTDVISILNRKNKKVTACKIDGFKEIMGINNRCELAEAEDYMRKKILENLMLSGVTVANPDTVYIDETVEIGRDVTVLPSTIIKGRTKIKTGSVVGPFSFIEDSIIGENVEIRASFVYGAEIADGVKIGRGVLIAAGSTITEDVPDNKLAIARERQIIKKLSRKSGD